MSYISYTHASGDPGRRGLVEEETKNLVNYLNDSGDVSGTYYQFSFGDCGVHAGGYGDTDDEEKQFIDDVIENMSGSLVDGETLCIAHGKALWGYGRARLVTTDSGKDITGCTVYAGSGFTGDWEVRGFTWHEAMHSFGANHEDGRFSLDGNYEMYDITPMAMSYLYDNSGEVDTTWEGTGTIPHDFCWGKNNEKYEYQLDSMEDNHTIHELAYCAEKNA